MIDPDDSMNRKPVCISESCKRMQVSVPSEFELNSQLPDLYPRIYRMVRSMLYGSAISAEDLTQDAFLKAYRKRHLYNGRSSLHTWVYQIARNTVLDALRRQKIRRRLFMDNEADSWSDNLPDSDTGDDAIDQRERRDLLMKALSALPGRDRLLITLRDLEGMAYQDIAEIENLAVGTVKSRLFTARSRLRNELMKLGADRDWLEG